MKVFLCFVLIICVLPSTMAVLPKTFQQLAALVLQLQAQQKFLEATVLTTPPPSIPPLATQKVIVATKSASIPPVESIPARTTLAYILQSATNEPVTQAVTEAVASAPVTGAVTSPPATQEATNAPTTSATVTEAPVTEAVTSDPVTETVTSAPVTEAVTSATVTEVVTEAVTSAPVREAATNAPVTEAVTSAPVTEAPTQPTSPVSSSITTTTEPSTPSSPTTPEPTTMDPAVLVDLKLNALDILAPSINSALEAQQKQLETRIQALGEQASRLQSEGHNIGGSAGDAMLKRAEEMRIQEENTILAAEILVELSADIQEFFVDVQSQRQEMAALLPTTTQQASTSVTSVAL